MKTRTQWLLTTIFTACLLVAASQKTEAQTLVFYEDWETDHSLDGTYVTNSTPGCVNLADLYFDYSTAGIPLSPNSTNSSTRALKLCANLTGGVFGGVSVSPVGFGITENFDMRFDAWFNFNGPLPGGGSGSTAVGGAGYGTAGTTAQTAGVADSVFIGATADGGSVADYRVYSPAHAISYQDGSYRVGSSGTDPAILGDPSSGYVYAGTNRNNTGAYYTANFPGQTVPAAQYALYPQQTNSSGTPANAPGTANNGALAFKWREISLQKIANTITYSIDGVLIATVDVIDAGTLGGSNILFNHYDINAGSSTDPNRTNLIFTLIDNVRVIDFTNVVAVTSTNGPSTAEASSPTPGVFTIFRSSSGDPLTVGYTLSGAAVNGTDYTNELGSPLSGTVTFAAAATQTNVFIYPVDDAQAELTENVTLSINTSPDYIGGGSATISLVDNETPVLTITNVSRQMYERTNDFATFQVSRLGDTNAASFNVNFSFAGTATYADDFYTNDLAVAFDPGAQTTTFRVYPTGDDLYEGNEIVTVNIAAASGGEYSIGPDSSASITLVDDDGAAETILFSDNFNTDSSANWTLYYAATNSITDPGSADYSALFAFDYSGQGVPPSPHGDGDTLGLFLTVNKNPSFGPTAAALNLYPVGKNFSGDFALRFDMWLNIPAAGLGNTTEYALFGINHTGTKTNWWRSGGTRPGWTFDGIFYTVESDTGSAPHYVNYSSPTTAGNNPTAQSAGTNASGFASYLKAPPWTIAGLPSVTSTNAALWSDVELSQVGNILTLRINNNTIFSHNNTNSYKSGNIMLGYLDAFDSRGPVADYVLYDNVRVVTIQGLKITGISDLGANIQIDFTFDLNDAPESFRVQGSSTVSGGYADLTATIVQMSPGIYRATVAKSGGEQFYRIRR